MSKENQQFDCTITGDYKSKEEYERCTREKIEKGLDDIKNGRFASNENVRKTFQLPEYKINHPTISQIYKFFNTPPNLVDHMTMVAMVVEFTKEHWAGDELGWDRLIKAALLHDLGNIVKFDMDKFPEFMGEEIEKIDYWKKTQKDVIKKYGSDDHEATKKMLSELGIEEDLVKLILDKSFGNVIKVAENDDWYAKVLLFADLKVSPMGIMLTEERIKDIKNRMPHYTKQKDFPEMLIALRALDKQIQTYLNVPISNVSNEVTLADKSKLFQQNITPTFFSEDL